MISSAATRQRADDITARDTRSKAIGSALPASAAGEHGAVDLEARLLGVAGGRAVPHPAGLVQVALQVERQPANEHRVEPVGAVAQRVVDSPTGLVIVAVLEQRTRQLEPNVA